MISSRKHRKHYLIKICIRFYSLQFIFINFLSLISDSFVFRFSLFQFAQSITGGESFLTFQFRNIDTRSGFSETSETSENEIKLRVLVIARYSFLFFGITSNPLDRWYVVSFIEIDRCAHPRRYLCTCLAFYHRARLIFPTTPRASGDNLSPAASSRRVSPFLRRDTQRPQRWKCSDAVILVCVTLLNCDVLKKKML